MNNDFLGHDWGNLPIIFTSDEVTSENYWKIASWLTNVLFYFLHAILSPWKHKIQISPLSLGTVYSDLAL